MTRSGSFAALIAALASTCLTSHLHAAVVQNNSFTNSQAGLPVASDDLLQTHLTSVTGSGSIGTFGGQPNINVLTDGALGPVGAVFQSDANISPSNAVITYTLNTALFPSGFDITRTVTTASWDTGRDGQEYSVAYATVSNPTLFLPLFAITAFNPASGVFNPSTSQVELVTSDGLPLATGVAAIQFTFTSFENFGTAYREIDVFASNIPEPFTAIGLLPLATLALTRRRR